jgi:DNA-binding transcriptional LysR family regulator
VRLTLAGEAIQNRVRRLLAESERMVDRALDIVISSDSMEDLAGLEWHRILSESYVMVVPRARVTAWGALDLPALAADVPLPGPAFCHGIHLVMRD